MPEWFLFIPQVRCEIADVVERAVIAEQSGFDGIALVDHLLTPMAREQTIWEAMTLATWVAARTTTLRICPLVLCDSFRHPAVLAKQVATLDHATGGRFELGLGAGSVSAELVEFDITTATANERIDGLRGTVETLARYLDDDPRSELRLSPKPLRHIPIVIGGSGPRILEIVADHADWWNLPAPELDKLPDLVSAIGAARVSIQQMVSYSGRDDEAVVVHAAARRRFGHLGAGLVEGDAEQLVTHFCGLSSLGVERFYVWFADFAAPTSVRDFAQRVIPWVT